VTGVPLNYIERRRFSVLSIKVASRHLGEDRTNLHDPVFNLREIVKQLILLEDHLAHPYKSCPDCIHKHLLTIEAMAEEATSLDTMGIFQREQGSVTEETAELARKWIENILDGRPLRDICKGVRQIRKELAKMVCDPREKGIIERVASRHLQRRLLCPHR